MVARSSRRGLDLTQTKVWHRRLDKTERGDGEAERLGGEGTGSAERGGAVDNPVERHRLGVRDSLRGGEDHCIQRGRRARSTTC